MIKEKIASFIDKYDEKRDWFFSKKWHYAITLPLLFLLLIGIYMIFCAREGTYDTLIFNQYFGVKSESALVAFRVIGGCLIGLGVATLIFRLVFKRLTGRDFARILVLSGCTALILFGFTNSLNEYGWHHDAGKLSSGNHWSIIYDIYSTGKIPDVQFNNQYYQPKVYHAIIAYWMKFVVNFIPGGTELVDASKTAYGDYTIAAYQALDSSRILMAYIGLLPLIVAPRIFGYLGLRKKGLAVATGIVVLIPQTWFIHFYMNNDGMSFALGVLALYAALRYRKTQDYLTIIGVAITLGLSMAIKLNGGFLAIPIAFVFLFVLLERILAAKRKEEKAKKRFIHFFIQIVIFAIIVFPLGLFVSIKNYIKYDEPIGYVLDLGTSGGMYIDPEFYNPFQRYFPYLSGDYFFSIFNHRWRGKSGGKYVNVYGVIDFNCWAAYCKTLLFGEKDIGKQIHDISLGLSGLAYYAVIFLFFNTVYGWVFPLAVAIKNKSIKRKDVFEPAIVIALLGITYAADYIWFCHKYPVGCTQNSRYVLYLIFVTGFVCAKIAESPFALNQEKLEIQESR